MEVHVKKSSWTSKRRLAIERHHVTSTNLLTPLPPLWLRGVRSVEMHFASPPIPTPHSCPRISGLPPEMKRFRRRCQALAGALGRALLSRRRLSGCAALEIPWNPIQGFIPLALLAGALVLPSPLPYFSSKTDTQLVRLGGYSSAVDQAAVNSRFSRWLKNGPPFWKPLPLDSFITAEWFSTSNTHNLMLWKVLDFYWIDVRNYEENLNHSSMIYSDFLALWLCLWLN